MDCALKNPVDGHIYSANEKVLGGANNFRTINVGTTTTVHFCGLIESSVTLLFLCNQVASKLLGRREVLDTESAYPVPVSTAKAITVISH